jgi:L-lactate permease
MNWKTWLQAFGVALVGGAAATTAQVVNNRVQYGPAAPPITGKSVGLSAGLGALVTGLAYLMRSPLTPPAPAVPLAAPPAQPEPEK